MDLQCYSITEIQVTTDEVVEEFVRHPQTHSMSDHVTIIYVDELLSIIIPT